MSELREPSKSSMASTLLDIFPDRGGCSDLLASAFSSAGFPLSRCVVAAGFLSFVNLRAIGGGFDVGACSGSYKIQQNLVNASI